MKAFHSLPLAGSARRALQAMLVVGALTGFAHGQILLEDNFSGLGSLANTAPEVNTSNTTWSVVDGNNTLGDGVDTFSNLGGSVYNSLAYSGSNFIKGDTYDLTVSFTSNGAGWLGIGFGYGANGGGNLFDTAGSATMLLDNGAGSWVAYYTNGVTAAVGGQVGANGTPGLDSGTMEIQMALDSSGNATLSYFIGPNANSLAEITASPGYDQLPLTLSSTEVDAITGVGFAGNGPIAGTLSSFELSIAPEPATCAMIAFGLGALVLGTRLRRLSSRV